MKHALVFSFLTLTFVNGVNAATVRRLSFDDLVAKSESIVEGQVLDSRTYWTSDRRLILTSYTVRVRESMKGKAPETVTVTTVGGKIGNTILHVSGMPVFEAGESAVLFLERSKSYLTVVGVNQGKFTISNGEVSNSVDGLSFPGEGSGKPFKMPLNDFKRQIRLHSIPR